MRFVIVSAFAASLALGGVAIAQTPGSGRAVTRSAYTVEPFTPASPIAIQGSGVRLRAEPFATGDTPVLSSGSTGLQLTVVGLARQPDWNWYQVILRNGQKAFIRSDYTSAPSRGDSTPSIAYQPPVQPPPQVAYTPPPQPQPAWTPPPVSQPLPPIPTQPLDGGAISLTPRDGLAPQLDLPPASNPAPAPVNNGLISIAPAAPMPRLSSSASGNGASISDAIRAQLDAKRCWTDSGSMMDAQRLRATFAVTFGQNGRFASEPRLIQPASEPADDPSMMVFIAKARAALRTCNALGFDVPADYFSGGQGDVRLDFTAR